MLYAIAKINGKQYKVTEDQVLTVDRLPVAEGKTTDIKDIIYVSQDDNRLVGADAKKATIKAKVVEELLGPKVLVFKYKKRKRHRKLTGHRQVLTKIKIESIDFPGKKKEIKKTTTKKTGAKEKPKAEQEAGKKNEAKEKSQKQDDKKQDSKTAEKKTATKSAKPKETAEKTTNKASVTPKSDAKKGQKKV